MMEIGKHHFPMETILEQTKKIEVKGEKLLSGTVKNKYK